MDEVFGIFPTPFMRAPGTLGAAPGRRIWSSTSRPGRRATTTRPRTCLTRRCCSRATARSWARLPRLITPKLVEFGVHLFGERLPWALKEMWVNVLDTGGRQAMHNHANSFISGVVYLTPTHPSSQTVFMKSPGGSEFMFRNDHKGTTPGEFSADKWISPAPEPGDMVLFPSYLMHAVPPNQGERRITLSFNAIPAQLNSWGYVIRFGG